jgi:hypothetical protein
LSAATVAVAAAAAADTFYSSTLESQRKNDLDTGFWNWHEPYPYTHAVVSAMTGGPILIGDGVNGSNRTLVMSTCSGEYICNTSEIQTGWSPHSERPFQR